MRLFNNKKLGKLSLQTNALRRAKKKITDKELLVPSKISLNLFLQRPSSRTLTLDSVQSPSALSSADTSSSWIQLSAHKACEKGQIRED